MVWKGLGLMGGVARGDFWLNVWMKWNGAQGKELVFVNEALLMDQDFSFGRGMVDVFIG
ncbi:hypothetical protein C1H46_017098 [Malus baccata]|uniref:Uncharacterized protein n=1 Tax=Malus baccata TaxID=106549 RepID=A0A540MET4_MALBA|nr:hypothetical protein C1H46_017098 [Malus baccata]